MHGSITATPKTFSLAVNTLHTSAALTLHPSLIWQPLSLHSKAAARAITGVLHLPDSHTLQVSFEAPPGVKRNLQRTYDSWGPSLVSKAQPLQAQLLFMLAWFHAIVQERRAYMPQASLLLINSNRDP